LVLDIVLEAGSSELDADIKSGCGLVVQVVLCGAGCGALLDSQSIAVVAEAGLEGR
jgi:hypothetical protein